MVVVCSPWQAGFIVGGSTWVVGDKVFATKKLTFPSDSGRADVAAGSRGTVQGSNADDTNVVVQIDGTEGLDCLHYFTAWPNQLKSLAQVPSAQTTRERL